QTWRDGVRLCSWFLRGGMVSDFVLGSYVPWRDGGGMVSVTTALAVLPTNRLRAGSKATDHFKRGRQDLILALSTCRLGRRRSGCVAAMFHQCPQRAFWPPRRAPRARESGCGFGKVTSGSRHDTNAISVERSARLSLPIGDGGGQQLSCRCWRCDTAHWTQPRRKTDKVAS